MKLLKAMALTSQMFMSQVGRLSHGKNSSIRMQQPHWYGPDCWHCVASCLVQSAEQLRRPVMKTLASLQRTFLSNATMSFGQKEPPQPTPSFCSSIGVI